MLPRCTEPQTSNLEGRKSINLAKTATLLPYTHCNTMLFHDMSPTALMSTYSTIFVVYIVLFSIIQFHFNKSYTGDVIVTLKRNMFVIFDLVTP
jgi:hypothetical protein